MHETDCEKALNLLIHDLRAPLSVALGYLRLVKDNRLSSGPERDRALDQTLQALGRMSRLCTDASAFATPPTRDAVPAMAVNVGRFIDQVAQACSETAGEPLGFDTDRDAGHGVVHGVHLDRLAEAVGLVLSAARRAAGGVPVRVEIATRDRELWFVLGQRDDRARLAESDDPFDAWRGGHGIALPLACRTITAAGGRIWSAADARGAVAIALPQELS
jgi:signal transduction histidine kinase